MMRDELKAFLCPRSVAIIGASDTQGTRGSFVMDGLITWGIRVGYLL